MDSRCGMCVGTVEPLTSFVCFGQVLLRSEKSLRAQLLGCCQLQDCFFEVVDLETRRHEHEESCEVRWCLSTVQQGQKQRIQPAQVTHRPFTQGQFTVSNQHDSVQTGDNLPHSPCQLIENLHKKMHNFCIRFSEREIVSLTIFANLSVCAESLAP